ncbi:acyl-CoA dehydrogenase [Pigmentiphaga aceris]|uniref:Dibenzothiophene monooxygenase n=1 Tax=Pigmentiphaga aceris TaxID=1940612 RepID=A0A5C0AZQ6_9BURK|nr:acyl-CoA dehydrogenase family protein [Pigmentiphaga aceris]QEI07808.1 acyl-CoA dehydrogenase [Pigmentiphaga aceris]
MTSTHTLDTLLLILRDSAIARDKQGGHAAQEKQLLREAGLLACAIPTIHGGDGRSWHDTLAIIRRIATVDSALAHLVAFHALQVATVLIFGSDTQKHKWLDRSSRENGWWGNALNPLDRRLDARRVEGGYVLNGAKRFCSGATGSSYLTISADYAPTGEVLLFVADTQQAGIRVLDDWNAIGQRQTDSGTVEFTNVFVPTEDVLRGEGFAPQPWHSVRAPVAQLILVNLYAGIAAGALEEARRYSLEKARPWLFSDVQQASEDPYRLLRIGEMHVHSATAAVMADRGAQLLDQSWQQGLALSAVQRQETALAVAEAKVIAHRASLYNGQALFDAAGASAAHAGLGLDRFWRNARTHTLHDPLDYKLRALGDWELTGSMPVNLYS